MVEDLRISMIQSHIIWGDREENLAYYGELIRRVQGRSDLAILPETFTTGFAINEAERLAEPVDGPTLKAVRQWAADYAVAVAGSFIVEENGHRYNRAFFMTPAGEAFFYDKRHLFRMAGEDTHFSPGDKRLIVPYKGWNICLQVCYDLRFPVFSRNMKDYDLAVYVASWPASRAEVWSALLKARAIENQCYVIGVNRVGDDPESHYSGNSIAIDAYGHTVAACTPEKEETVCAELDLAELEEFRKKFPVLEDRDIFELK